MVGEITILCSFSFLLPFISSFAMSSLEEGPRDKYGNIKEPIRSLKVLECCEITHFPHDNDKPCGLVEESSISGMKSLSDSKDFVDTSSLAQHAFTSCQIGYRTEHLGLHKALCVLMGWSCMHMPKGSWARHILPDSEAFSIKEDLIIWPAVVIIHNSSVTSDNPGERMIVSVEQLGSLLSEIGFGRGMANICRGRAANHSMMVMNFSGTFSGLLEAERLHKHYVANKLGRAEFQKFGLDSSMRSSQETQSTPADKVESDLYGYLGIAGDLDKLGLETKKQCVVKSKKENEAVAEASFNT